MLRHPISGEGEVTPKEFAEAIYAVAVAAVGQQLPQWLEAQPVATALERRRVTEQVDKLGERLLRRLEGDGRRK